MYNCSNCQKTTKPGTSKAANTRITEIRQKTYYNNVKGDVFISRGWEISKEEAFCPSCALLFDLNENTQSLGL